MQFPKRILFLILIIFSWQIISCESKNKKISEGENYLIELNKKIASNPNSYALYIERGKYYIVENKLNEAVGDMRKAVELSPNEEEPYLILSSIYITRGEAQNAIDILKSGLNKIPNSTEIRLSMANLFLVMKDYEQCAKAVEETLQIDPNNAQAYTIKGLTLMENEEMKLATTAFQHALTLDPDNYDALMQLGYIFEETDTKMAIDYFASAAKNHADKFEPRFNLGLLYQKTSEPRKAAQVYEEILSVDSLNQAANYNLGYVNMVFMADFDKSIKYFNNAIRLDSTDINAWYNRGYSYELSEKYDQALKDYNKILEIETNNSHAIAGKNRLDKLMK